VGNGGSLIETVEAAAGTTACVVAADGAGCAGRVSLALMTAQPPIVAATEAAVMNIFTPGIPVVGFLLGFTGGMSQSFSSLCC
jgi:hypothetical protein